MTRMTREEIKELLRTEPYQPGTIVRLDNTKVIAVTKDGLHARIGYVLGTTITWGTQQYIG